MGKAKRLRLEKSRQAAAGRGPSPEGEETGITAEDFGAAEYMSIEWPRNSDDPDSHPGICMSVRLFNKSIDPFSGRARFSYGPTEDSIHPFPLKFDPPLREFGSEAAAGFQKYWEKLSYVFDLPNPDDFPCIEVGAPDRPFLERFVRQCRRLAGFSLLNANTKFSALLVGRQWDVKLIDPPSDEAFLAASAVFRQLHNENESASFNNACNALFKVIKNLSEREQSVLGPSVQAWRSARGKLMNTTIQTLTIMAATNATLDKPISFRDVQPDSLIRRFNYGDSLHFDVDAGLVDLMQDERHEAYYTYAAMVSILGLSHLYCGFAVLLEHALGGVD